MDVWLGILPEVSVVFVCETRIQMGDDGLCLRRWLNLLGDLSFNPLLTNDEGQITC